MSNLVLILVFLFPLTVLSFKSIAGLIFGVLALAGVVYFFTTEIKNTAAREEKLLYFSSVFFFVVAVIVMLNGGVDDEALQRLSKFFNLILIVPLYAIFKRFLINDSIIWISLALGLLLTGGIAVYQTVLNPVVAAGYGVVAHGSTHPMLFGAISMTMALTLFVAIDRAREKSVLWLVLLFAAFVAGIVAAILSGSVRIWLAMPVSVLFIYLVNREYTPAKYLNTFLILILVLPLVLYLTPGVQFSHNVNQSWSAVAQYFSGTDKTTTEAGRIDMIVASWEIFKQHPWLGAGWGNYQAQAHQLIESMGLVSDVARWVHPHNEYLAAMANGGLLMLLAMLFLLLIPMRLFINAVRYHHDRQLWQYGVAGVVLTGTYLSFAFVEAIFERSLPTIFFAFYTALFLSQITRAKKALVGNIKRDKTLSVIIITKNEEDRIERCLKSVHGWADEIIVLDSGSTDNTVGIVRKYTDNVFETDWPGYGKQKQRALDKATGDWVLSLDADEEVSEELRTEIDGILNDESTTPGFRIPWAVVAYGQRLDFGRMGHAPLRLFKRDAGYFTPADVHERVMLNDSREGLLQARLLHYSYRDMKHSMDKHDQYAWLWANERFRKGKKPEFRSAVIHGLWTFFIAYIVRFGFLDGRAGLIMAVHVSVYTFNKYAALWSLVKQSKAEQH